MNKKVAVEEDEDEITVLKRAVRSLQKELDKANRRIDDNTELHITLREEMARHNKAVAKEVQHLKSVAEQRGWLIAVHGGESRVQEVSQQQKANVS